MPKMKLTIVVVGGVKCWENRLPHQSLSSSAKGLASAMNQVPRNFLSTSTLEQPSSPS